jgi:cell division ATPase FtsA
LDLEESSPIEDSLNLAELDVWEEWVISRTYLSKIATARYEEIFYFVREELRKIWKDGMLPEWAVCVWWWAKMKWFVELAKKSLRLPIFVWLPVSKDDLVDASISDPLFSAVIWTMILSNMYWNHWKMFSINFGSFFESLKKLFKKILP